MKPRMGATHFLTKTIPKVAAEMALSVLAYNLTRVMNIIGIKPLIAAIRGLRPTRVFAPSADVPLKPFLHDQDPNRTFVPAGERSATSSITAAARTDHMRAARGAANLYQRVLKVTSRSEFERQPGAAAPCNRPRTGCFFTQP